jgi:alkylation response protein AidB-like acyl-CoA dehydrogenase
LPRLRVGCWVGILRDGHIRRRGGHDTNVDRSASNKAAPRPPITVIRQAPRPSSEAVGRIADRAVQIHGGSGYIRGIPVERLYRDVRLFRIYEGTSQIQQLVIAREMLR